MSRATSWRLALRLARRDALRHRGRSILVLVMIALPVLAVTAADVVIATQDVSSVEGLERRMGSAEALLRVEYDGQPLVQKFDPNDGGATVGRGGDLTPPTEAELSAALGGVPLVAMRNGQTRIRTQDGAATVEATEVDLRDPVTEGLFELTSGRWPVTAGEIVVNQALLDEGYLVGDRLEPADEGGPDPLIVGVAESASTRTWAGAAGPTGSLGLRTEDWGPPSWLAAGDPVSWATVREVNALGASVLSRAVITDPPPESVLPEEVAWSESTDDAMIAVIALIVVMALLEVVLLAGPAFAVTARRQSRTLALMAASGGTPAQGRRVILGVGLVLGSAAALGGVVLGIGVGRLLVPVLQRWSDSRFGPFDVPWPHLAGIAAFGLLSALLAAVVPAVIASRQDVVAVLAGRRADKRPSLRSPVLGVVLLGVGVAGSAYGARATSDGELAIAAAAVVAVLGMILLVPVVVVGVARLAGRLPLSPRYAARDAARHRTRTVPAVAAVAATVAGVVALGIAVTSDEAENRQRYVAELPMGMGAVTAYTDDAPVDWEQLRERLVAKLPEAEVTEVRGLLEGDGVSSPSAWLDIKVHANDEPARLLESYGGSWGPATLVGARSLTDLPIDLSDEDRAAASRVLREGGVVAFTDHGVTAEELLLELRRWDPEAEVESVTRARVPALVLPMALGNAGPQAILSDEAADELGAEVGVSGLLVDGPITRGQQESASEALLAASDGSSSFYVERGYEADDETVIVQLVLAALGGVLMLGGTLTATFLALSDARPDLATLAAVGAAPRRRRAVAASYALVIGFVGSVLGAAVGFIPGIAVTYPLTRGYDELDQAHYLDVPWLMVLGIVVALPILTAVVVGLATRSRLPLVARLD